MTTNTQISQDSMIAIARENGFTGGKYGEERIYVNTPWNDKTDELQKLFPECNVQRLPNDLITVIKAA
jgi:hypothetical protein